ncbi:MAG: hypothetical protein ACTSRP_23230 [Candidatus Helarchaeota archaeon]
MDDSFKRYLAYLMIVLLVIVIIVILSLLGFNNIDVPLPPPP